MSKAKLLKRIIKPNQPKGPIKVTSPDLNAKGNDVAIEEVRITHDGIDKVEI